jgi:peptide-methionine (S)-S-oxide reductase
VKEFERIYPANGDAVDSTAAARVNGYLGGYGTSSGLKTDLNRLGHTAEGSQYLLRIVEFKNP